MKFINQAQRVAIYIFFFSINFEMWDPTGTGGIFSIAKLSAIIYFITIAPQLPQFIRIDNLLSVLSPIWIFIGFLTFMSMINNNELSSGFIYSPLILNMIIFWMLINHERKDYLIIEKGMFCFALGSILLVLLFFAGIGVNYETGNRLSMFGDNQNSIGIKMAVSAIILLLMVTQNRLNMGRFRYIFLLIIPFMLIFIRETGSRQSILAFILAFLTGTVFYKTQTKMIKVGILIGSVLVLISIGILLMQNNTLIERFQSTSNSGDLGERDYIWRSIFPIIQGNPIIGVGKTGYEMQTTIMWGRYESPHNVILEILCYTGIIGLSLYLAFIFQVFKRGYQSYKKDGWLLPMLLIIPIMGQLLGGHILESKLGWSIYAYIISSSAIAIKSLNNHPKKQLLSEDPLCN